MITKLMDKIMLAIAYLAKVCLNNKNKTQVIIPNGTRVIAAFTIMKIIPAFPSRILLV